MKLTLILGVLVRKLSDLLPKQLVVLARQQHRPRRLHVEGRRRVLDASLNDRLKLGVRDGALLFDAVVRAAVLACQLPRRGSKDGTRAVRP